MTTSPSPAPGLNEIGQIAITVADVAAATAFYRDVLGLKFLFAAGPRLAFFAAGGIRLMITRPDGAGEPGKNSILYFRVSDIQTTYDSLVQKGATPGAPPNRVARMPDHDLWIAEVRDPENNVIALMSEVPRAAT
ncbi:MAG TPA: VOC family protein [Candidatus Didemnitutus sp.]|nr:VOC family protein [Candidatus Didemnitutus sp.]